MFVKSICTVGDPASGWPVLSNKLLPFWGLNKDLEGFDW